MKNISVFLNKNKIPVLASGIIALFLHVIFFQSINSLMILPFLFSWIIIGIIYKLDEKYFFGIAIFFLVLSVPPLLLGKIFLSERLSVWEFLFLILGLWQWVFLQIPFFNKKK